MKSIGFASVIAGALTAGIIGPAVPAIASAGNDDTEVNLQAPNPTQWTWDPSHGSRVETVLNSDVLSPNR